MNLPFGLSAIKEPTAKKNNESAEIAALYEHRLQQYQATLEQYKKCIKSYAEKLDNYDKHSIENQLSTVQLALDMTYLKEQGDKIIELQNSIKSENQSKLETSFESISQLIQGIQDNMEGIDKNVVNRLSELFVELQKQSMEQNRLVQNELTETVRTLTVKVKKGNALLWFFIILNFLGWASVAFLVLYEKGFIPFLS